MFPVFKDEGAVGRRESHREEQARAISTVRAQQPQLGGEAPQEPVHQGEERHIQHSGAKAHREKAEDLPVVWQGNPGRGFQMEAAFWSR